MQSAGGKIDLSDIDYTMISDLLSSPRGVICITRGEKRVSPLFGLPGGNIKSIPIRRKEAIDFISGLEQYSNIE